MLEISKKAIVLIEQQSYSQEMMELLINDLMDHAKFENDQFQLNVEKFDLSQVVFKALNIAQSKANYNQIQLIADIDKPEHMSLIQCLYGDEQRLV